MPESDPTPAPTYIFVGEKALPACTTCGIRPCVWRQDDGRFGPRCWKCSRTVLRNRSGGVRTVHSLAGPCSRCGFVPEHYCQREVDHIDGNHANGSPENLQVLCANCHRLKSFQTGQNGRRRYEPPDVRTLLAPGPRNRRIRKGEPGYRGTVHPRAKLTDAQVAELRALYTGGKVTQQVLAARFGISQGHLSHIVRGTRWAQPTQ